MAIAVGILYTNEIRPDQMIVHPAILSTVPPINRYSDRFAVAIGRDMAIDIALQFGLNVGVIYR